MDTILHSEVFDHFDKTYLLDRIKGHLSGPVIRITETVHNGTRRGKYTVEIDAEVLKRVQELMQASVAYDPSGKPERVVKRLRLTPADREKIVRSYLRGVPAADLALQLGCTVGDVEGILRQNGIAIVDQAPPAPRPWQSNWKRKK